MLQNVTNGVSEGLNDAAMKADEKDTPELKMGENHMQMHFPANTSKLDTYHIPNELHLTGST
jgi:hypothetical protein